MNQENTKSMSNPQSAINFYETWWISLGTWWLLWRSWRWIVFFPAEQLTIKSFFPWAL